jgi:hypothetical protein
MFPYSTDPHRTNIVPAFRFTNTDFEIRSVPTYPVNEVGMVAQVASNIIRFWEETPATGSGNLVSRWHLPEVVKFTIVNEDDEPILDRNGEPLVKFYGVGMGQFRETAVTAPHGNGNWNVDLGSHIRGSNAVTPPNNIWLTEFLQGPNYNISNMRTANHTNLNNHDGLSMGARGEVTYLFNNSDASVRNAARATDFYFTEDGASMLLSGLNRVHGARGTQLDFQFFLSFSPNYNPEVHGHSVRLIVEGNGLGAQYAFGNKNSVKLSDVQKRVDVDVESTSRINLTQSTEARVGSVAITENRAGALLVAPFYVLDVVAETNDVFTNNTRTATNHFRFVDSADRLKIEVTRADGLDTRNAAGFDRTQLVANVWYSGVDGVLADGTLRVNNSIDLKVTRSSTQWVHVVNRTVVANNADGVENQGFGAKLTISGFHVHIDRFVNEGNYYIALGTNDSHGRFLPVKPTEATIINGVAVAAGQNVPGNYQQGLFERIATGIITNDDQLKVMSSGKHSENLIINNNITQGPNLDYINNNATRTEVLLTSTMGYAWYRFYDWGFNSNDYFITVQNPLAFQPGMGSSIMFLTGSDSNRIVSEAIVDGAVKPFTVVNVGEVTLSNGTVLPPGSESKTPIIYQNGTHYVPLRSLAEMFGLTLNVDLFAGRFEYKANGLEEARWYDVITVMADGRLVRFFFGQDFYLIEGVEVPMTRETNGQFRKVGYGNDMFGALGLPADIDLLYRTYLPLGDFMNAFGVTYLWPGHVLHPGGPAGNQTGPYANKIIINPGQYQLTGQ